LFRDVAKGLQVRVRGFRSVVAVIRESVEELRGDRVGVPRRLRGRGSRVGIDDAGVDAAADSSHD
jgi:hypothetical protein